MIELIVFDLDGTLVDSHKDLAKAANTLVRELGGTAVSEEDVVRMVGEGAAVLVRRALTASGLDPDTPGALDRFLEVYDACLLDQTKPYPGMVELLANLAGRYRLAILTNKPSRATTRVVEGLDLARFFDPVVGGDSPLGRKPDPAGLLAHRQEGAGDPGIYAAGRRLADRSPHRPERRDFDLPGEVRIRLYLRTGRS